MNLVITSYWTGLTCRTHYMFIKTDATLLTKKLIKAAVTMVLANLVTDYDFPASEVKKYIKGGKLLKGKKRWEYEEIHSTGSIERALELQLIRNQDLVFISKTGEVDE